MMTLRRLGELFFVGAVVGFFGAVLLLFVGVSSASAALIDHTACTDPAVAGFGGYVNCGAYQGTFPGNDPGGWIEKFDPNSGWANGGGAGWSVTGTPGTSGTWTSPVAILAIFIKTSNRYSVYNVGGSTSGNWATAPTLLNPPKNNAQGLSHLAFYLSDSTPCQLGVCGNVPEPGALSLLGLGLLGLGLGRRRVGIQLNK